MSWLATQPHRTAPADPAATEIAGVLAEIRQCWANSDGTFTVLGYTMARECVRGTVEARGELVPGGDYRFLGRWTEHEKYGWQFAFDAVLAEAPDDPEGVAAYLSRHADRVGLVTAARLVAAYGTDAVRVLLDDAARVVHDAILSEADAALASDSLRRIYADPALREAHRQLFSLLRGHGFYGKAMKAALRRWRASAPAQVRRDPFLLMTHGMPGCGFLKCDRLWTALGKSPRRLKRQALAAWHALDCLNGDTWASVAVSLRAVRQQIGGTEPREKRAVALLCRARLAETITDGKGQVWLAEHHKAHAERTCAHMIRVLGKAEPQWPAVESLGLDPERDIHQIDRLRDALGSPVAVLSGSPGTGKTHCAAQVIKGVIKAVGLSKIAVCAPTGKAAVRISEKLAEARIPLKATTIHAMLKVRPNDGAGWSFEHDDYNRLPFSHVVVDETSMIDVGLAASLLRACTPGINLLFVGDPHQLPPVGHGAFLRDLIDAGQPRAHLTEIRRNAGLIVRACHGIKDGKLPKLPASLTDFPKENLIQLPWGGERSERQRALQERLDSVYDWLAVETAARGWDIIDDVQVICPRNVTRESLNTHLQTRLNAAGAKGPSGYRVGDKVICKKNGFVVNAEDRNHAQIYVANGDIGRARAFQGRAMLVELQSPRRQVIVPLGKAAAQQLEAATDSDEGSAAASWELAYACTCHRYQGSEVQVAIVVVENAGLLGSREWIYTAISRARSLCVLIGDTADLKKYVRNVTLPDRKTFLKELITGGMPL